MTRDSFHLEVQLQLEKELKEDGISSVLSQMEITRIVQLAGKVAADVHELDKEHADEKVKAR